MSPTDWNTDFSLVLVVLVVTTSVTTVEGAIQAGIGFFVTEQILHRPPGPHRCVEPDRRALRIRRADLRRAPRGRARVPEAPLDERFERLFFAAEADAEERKAPRHVDVGCQWLTSNRS